MAEAKGSSSAASAAAAAVPSGNAVGIGIGDLIGAAGQYHHHHYPAASSFVHASSAGTPGGGHGSRQNLHHQFHAGLIRPPPPMPVHVRPPPYVAHHHQLAMPLPQHRAAYQNQLSHGSYQQDQWNTVSDNNAPQQFHRSFPDWTMYNGMYNSDPFMSSLSHAAANNTNGFHPNLSCSINTWTNNININMMRNPGYNNYPPAIEDHQHPPFHNNNHEKDSGFATSYRMDPPLLPSSPFTPMSPAPNSFSTAQIFNEPATYTTNQVNNLEDAKVFGNSDMESDISDELEHTPAVVDLPNMNPSKEKKMTARFNCREYRVVVRKELTNSDVGNIGRIVVPKRDAEAHLPALLEREGVLLRMDDFKIPASWNFKYRFWPNNKSRMYILECTGDFVKAHGLQTGDNLIIYKSDSGRYIVRGEKTIQQNAIPSDQNCICKTEGNYGEECGFTISLQARRT